MLLFLRCVGEAVVARGLRGLMGLVPYGEQVYDVSGEVIDRYRQARRQNQMEADLQAVVQAEREQIRQEVVQIAREVSGGRADEERLQVEAYLSQISGVARQSMRRPEDPSGTTVPRGLDLREPTQLASLLPRRAPRFRIGEPQPHAPQWHFVELLGSGGFGEVWLVHHTYMNQRRAVKFCLDPASQKRLLGHEKEVVQRVMEASKGIKETEHGIVPLVDAYLEGDAPWLGYEYVDGGDLTGLVRQLSGIDPATRGRYVMSLLQCVAHVVGRFHRMPQPIVHRDLKPANILLKNHGKSWLVRVTDFGIS